MFKARWAVRGAVTAALITAAITAGGLLWLMFTSGDGFEHGDIRVSGTRFFGTLVFEVMEKNDGALDVTTGVDNPVPLIALFLALTVAFTAIQAMYAVLKQRRDQLPAQQQS